MPKPTVFVSHITEEGEVAKSLKSLIERKFLRSIDVFVSSHEESIGLGDEWLDSIKNSVTNCGLMVVICSPISITRPWINFEAGAGWVRGISVIPMCHSGIQPGKLPIPLNTFQAGMLGSQQDIQKLFMRLAILAHIDAPNTDAPEFFSNIHSFETSTKANVLLKDSKFIENLTKQQVRDIEHCIYASTRDWDFFFSSDPCANIPKLEDFEFTLNEVYHLFNSSLVVSTTTPKVFQVFLTSISRLADTTKFILSNNHIEIDPELKGLLDDFLFSLGQVEKWAYRIEIMELTKPDRRKNLFDEVFKMIKEEKLPPTRKSGPNIINMFIDYYDSLIYYKNWVISYRATIKRLTGS